MKFWIRSVVILIIGLGLCVGSYYAGKSSINKLLHWETVQVNVPFYGSGRSGREKVMIPFTYEGKSYEVKAYLKDLGRYESVIFPKDNPSNGEIRSIKNLLGVPIFLIVAGLIMTAIGFFSMQNRIAGTTGPSAEFLAANPTRRDILEEIEKRNKEAQ